MRKLSARIQSILAGVTTTHLSHPLLDLKRFWQNAASCGKAYRQYLSAVEMSSLPGDMLPGNPGAVPQAIQDSLPPQPFVPEYFDAVWDREGFMCLGGNHLLPDYAAVLAEGFPARAARCRKSAANATDAGKKDFYLGMADIADGILIYLERLAEYTAQHADTELAAKITALTQRAPESFHEALLAYWIIFLLTSDSPGLPDRVLEPYYQRDLAAGRITEDEAFELIANFFCKIHWIFGEEHAFGGINHLSIGGSDSNGNCVAGAVTGMCLDAAEALGLVRPQIVLRWSAQTPRKLLQRGLEVLAAGNGSPDFSNDETFVPALMALGIPRHAAVNYSPSGCNEVTIPGDGCMRALYGHFNVLSPLLVVLGTAKFPVEYPHSPLPESFDELYSEWEKKLSGLCNEIRKLSVIRSNAEGDYNSLLIFSLFSESALSSGKSLFAGGAAYNSCNWCCQGLIQLSDSMLAIKKGVFEQNICSLAELTLALQADWQGYDTLRQQLHDSVAGFGSGEADSAEMIARLTESISRILNSEPPPTGGKYTLGTLGGYENAHVVFGAKTPATPDGRRNGEPFSSGFTPGAGRDTDGITAVLQSAAAVPSIYYSTSTITNITLSPDLFAGEMLEKTTALVESYFRMGGIQLQPTIADRETLCKAQQNPSDYPSLTVRVAGYSARFTALSKEVQDEIIRRAVNKC